MSRETLAAPCGTGLLAQLGLRSSAAAAAAGGGGDSATLPPASALLSALPAGAALQARPKHQQRCPLLPLIHCPLTLSQSFLHVSVRMRDIDCVDVGVKFDEFEWYCIDMHALCVLCVGTS